MSKYVVNGGNALNGELIIDGAKNSVLPILASTILINGINILKNVPILSDTLVAIEILKSIGCKVKIDGNTVIVNSKNICNYSIPEDLVKKMRSSIIFLGSLLSRVKKAQITYPGGCKLGKRPIDFHINSLKKLGVIVSEEDNIIKAVVSKIDGAEILLPFASVGATQNIILASVFSKGKTIIQNPAKEPEIVDLQNFLNKIGCNIIGAGTEKITITGVESLKNFVEYTIMPDRIEAGTFLCMVAGTKGSVKLKNVIPSHLHSLTKILNKIGCDIKIYDDSILINSNKQLNSISFLETGPYPLFPTDLQPQLVSLLSISNGKSIIKETIFEARNMHISELNKMGANILEKNSVFTINGVNNLIPSLDLKAKDLRGGASLICAALCTKGKSMIDGSLYVERGYTKIENKLALLGADIKYVKD